LFVTDRKECSKNVYKDLDEESRSARIKGDRPYECDIALVGNEKEEAWFRFTGKAGNVMAMFAPQTKYCDTLLGGWMNGTLPKNKDVVVERKVR
jgi:hypothetical protein